MFSAVFFLSVFLGVSGVQREQKFLGVLGGFPWCLPKHQGKEGQGNFENKQLCWDPTHLPERGFRASGPKQEKKNEKYWFRPPPENRKKSAEK